MKKISISSLGQLAKADIDFGDMTILVGPQASGKSILLQLFKLALDYGPITKTLKQYYDWKGNVNDFLSLYFGEGMRGIWRDSTKVLDDGREFDLSILSHQSSKRDESVLLIPAQRVITLKDGWPRTFLDYAAGDPYVVRQFSEHLRRLMEAGLGDGNGAIFPQIGRMNEVIRQALEESIFNGAEVRLDKTTMRKRIVLKVGNHRLPFMVWSAGQREFIPLLMGLYWLTPSPMRKKKNIEWVVIEEPEMGLHPQAISALLIVFLELMHRGYKVIISTHSPQILELVWAIQNLSRRPGVDAFLKMFGLKKTEFLSKLGEDILAGKTFKTYYFARHRKKFKTIDISTLDPGSMDEAVSEWGGLTSFSARVSEVVSEAAQGEQ